MSDVNFCPHCDASQHKLLRCSEELFYCKSCNIFFQFKEIHAKCERCEGNLVKSDFDAPDGGAIFFCQKCKKTYPASEIISSL